MVRMHHIGLGRRGHRRTINEGQSQPVPNESIFSIVGQLKACATQKNLEKGSKLHAYIREHMLLENHLYIAKSLVNMYAKCGAVAKAQEVLKEQPVHDIVMWNTLIAGYVQQGQGKEALDCYDLIQSEGHSPNAVTFTYALKACGCIQAAAKGEQIYYKILNLGMLEKDVLLGSSLVHMYVKCGALAKAQQVLEELPVRNAVTWNTLMTGYAKQGLGVEVLKCYDSMQCEGHSPDAVTFTCALKACGNIGAIVKGEQIHYKLVSLGMLDNDDVLVSALVDMYAKCGVLAKAQHVLEAFPFRDVFMWSALIAGYAEQGQGEEALKCFDDMQIEGHSPDAVTFICALQACGSIKAVGKGEQIHENVASLCILEKDPMVGSALVDMYAKCGVVTKAQQVFEELPVRDVVTWNALIAGYVQQGQGDEVLKFFDGMQEEGLSPDAVTFAFALKASEIMNAVLEGEYIHEKIVSFGILEKNIVLGNALVNMYAQCGSLAKAQQLLGELPVRDVVTWSALIAGYAQQGQGEEALKCFDNMQCDGHFPNLIAFICALKACVSIGAALKVEQIHEKILKSDILDYEIVLGNTLVDIYAKCGALGKAQQVLEDLPLRTVVTWNALITGFAQQRQGEQALKCYDRMQYEGLFPNITTFTYGLKACGSIGASVRGKQMHEMIADLGMLGRTIVLGTTLVDMYVKFGAITKAQQVLEELPVYDIAVWSILIAGYAQQGQSVEALNCFEMMQFKGVEPNSTILTCVLNACGHAGLSNEAVFLFSTMRNEYGIMPDEQHYGCMLNLFGRAGKLDKALVMIENMPSVECLPLWIALLSACCKLGEVRIGRLAFEHALHRDKNDDGLYVSMGDIYRAAGMAVDASKIDLMRVTRCLDVASGLT